MRILATIILTVAGGLLMAFAVAVFVGPTVPMPMLSCPVGWSCVTTERGGADLWTGEVRPRTVAIYDGTTFVREISVPENYKDSRAVPVPVSFVAGSLLTLTVITIAVRRPRRLAPDSPVSAT